MELLIFFLNSFLGKYFFLFKKFGACLFSRRFCSNANLFSSYWLAELGPMFYSVKVKGAGTTETRREALNQLNTMENEMKEAEER